jgi:hypothetical protein
VAKLHYNNIINIMQDSIDAINTDSNHDAPEAMLEAILQVAVCKDVVGWREAARKLILVMTDQGFHTAGDGRVICMHEGPIYQQYQI